MLYFRFLYEEKNKKFLLNPRIPVIGVVGAFAVVILIVAYSGTSVIDDTSGEARLGSSTGAVIEPLVIDLDEIIIKDVDERTAYVEIAFKVTNPNYKSVILEMIRYNVYEDGMKIGTKSIATEPLLRTSFCFQLLYNFE